MEQLSRTPSVSPSSQSLFSISSAVLAQAPGAAAARRYHRADQGAESKQPAQFTASVEAIDAVDIRARIQGFLPLRRVQGRADCEGRRHALRDRAGPVKRSVASARAQVARAEATPEGGRKNTLPAARNCSRRKTVSQAIAGRCPGRLRCRRRGCKGRGSGACGRPNSTCPMPYHGADQRRDRTTGAYRGQSGRPRIPVRWHVSSAWTLSASPSR